MSRYRKDFCFDLKENSRLEVAFIYNASFSKRNNQFGFCYEIKQIKPKVKKGSSASLSLTEETNSDFSLTEKTNSEFKFYGVDVANYFKKLVLKDLLLEIQREVRYKEIKINYSFEEKFESFTFPILPPLESPMLGKEDSRMGTYTCRFVLKNGQNLFYRIRNFYQEGDGKTDIFMNTLVPEPGERQVFNFISADGVEYKIESEFVGKKLTSRKVDILAFYEEIIYLNERNSI